MKYIIILLLLIVSFGYSQTNQTNYQIDWVNNNSDFRFNSVDNYFNSREIFNVFGPVKKITQMEFKVIIIKDSIIKKKTDFGTDNYLLNYDGSSVEKHYIDDGNIYTSEIYKKNIKGHLISKITKYHRANNKYEIESFEYESNLIKKKKYYDSVLGDISHEFFFSKNGFINKSTEKIDGKKDNFRIKKFEYEEKIITIRTEDKLDGILRKFITKVYFNDEEISLIEEKYEGYNDVKKIKLNYDEFGNLISLNEFTNDELIEEKTFKYEYDDFKNWVSKIIFINKKPKYEITREIIYK